MDLETNRITRHEVLVRLLDDDGKLIFPDQFIPVAGQVGQIHAIDRWVIEHAILQLQNHPHISLSVNLAGNVIDDPELPQWIHPLLIRNGVDPSRLTFEITETAAVQNMEAAASLMEELRKLGCRFALDDFGSGFSSYFYLKQLPVDIVKIDGAFIRHLTRNPDDRLFVKALTDVAHGLGKQTVAEFVEDADTLTLLRQYGVNMAQGFYIGRPGASFAPSSAPPFADQEPEPALASKPETASDPPLPDHPRPTRYS